MKDWENISRNFSVDIDDRIAALTRLRENSQAVSAADASLGKFARSIIKMTPQGKRIRSAFFD